MIAVQITIDFEAEQYTAPTANPTLTLVSSGTNISSNKIAFTPFGNGKQTTVTYTETDTNKIALGNYELVFTFPGKTIPPAEEGGEPTIIPSKDATVKFEVVGVSARLTNKDEPILRTSNNQVIDAN